MDRDREAYFNYSINSSRSRISYLSNINNFIQDSNIYNQANLLEMLQNMPQENDNIMEENSVDIGDNVDNLDNVENGLKLCVDHHQTWIRQHSKITEQKSSTLLEYYLMKLLLSSM